MASFDDLQANGAKMCKISLRHLLIKISKTMQTKDLPIGHREHLLKALLLFADPGMGTNQSPKELPILKM